MALRSGSKLEFLVKYKDSLTISLCLQVPLLLWAYSELNGRILLQIMLVAAIAYWAGAGIIMVRRNGAATRIDVFILKWGYLLTLALTMVFLVVASIGLLHRA
jgi:hypothetical protein